MCCRFCIELSKEMQALIEKAEYSPLRSRMSIALSKPLMKEGEIRPMDMVSVIASSKTGREAVFPMVWGFSIPRTKNPVFNARMETAKEKDLFRDSWNSRRCVIPCSWYIEWEHLKDDFTGKTKTGDKYAIQPKNSSITYLAGLYRMEEGHGITYPVFTILTREPSQESSFIHDRMPLILPQTCISDWIRPDSRPEEIIGQALTDMVFERTA